MREIIKRRIGPDGVDINCTTEVDKYLDLKETKKTTYTQGRGEHYRKTTYTYNEHSTERKYEDVPLRIENPADTSDAIDYQRGVIKHYWIAAGRGQHYQKTRVIFDNTAANESRKTRTQRITNSSDSNQYIDVERIEKIRLAQRRGALYRVKHVHLTNTEAQIAAMTGPCKTTT